MKVKKVILSSLLCAAMFGVSQGSLAAENTEVGVWHTWRPKTVIPVETPAEKPAAQPKTDNVKLRVYDPVKDAAPKEPMAIKETNFRFREKLLVRPKTDTIVIHHVGIPDGDTSAAAIHRAHLANGWAGIGYHYVIRKDGTIERGRPLATVGAHSQSQNYHTVGINVTGNFQKEIPTKAQIHSLEDLLFWLCKTYNLQPGPKTIVGHRDENSTECPGENLYRLLPQIRKDVAADFVKEKMTAAQQKTEKTKLASQK